LSVRRGWWLLALVLIAAYFLYFFRAGDYPLLDPDEPVYGQVAREMASGGDWLTPHYQGQPWFDKPPLFYWLSAASTELLGPTELAARLPSAVLAVVLVGLVFLLAAREYGARTGALAAAVLATCLQQIILARAAVTDITFVVCLTASLYFYLRWVTAEGRGRWAAAILCGVMAGLGALAKGPVAPLLLAGTFFLHLAFTRRLGWLLRPEVAAAVLAALAVGLPWFLLMYRLHGDLFVQGFLVANNIQRFLQPEHAEVTGAWYSYFLNVPTLLVMFFPWSVFVPQAVTRAWREGETARLCLVWAAVVFVFFSLSKTQLVTYIFPVYPAAAVLVALLWRTAAQGEARAQRGLRRALVGAALFGVLLVILGPSQVVRKMPELQGAVMVLAGWLALGPLVAWGLARRRAPRLAAAAVAVVVSMVLFTGWLLSVIMPVASLWYSTKPMAEAAAAYPGARQVSFHYHRPSLIYYFDDRLAHTDDPAVANTLLAYPEPVVMICQDFDLGRLDLSRSTIVAQSGRLRLLVNGAARRMP
jgi:4-amino-4-deoxy-L-arabinose transferase-like glycosyltransferase